MRLVDSFTAPKDVLREFADLTEEENVDPFAETQSQRQIASHQSEYHNRKFSRVAQESADAFKPTVDGKEVEGGYKDAMRLARLENEEARVKRTIAENREEGKMKMDLNNTPPAAEIEDVAKELATAKESSSGTKRKRRWDVQMKMPTLTNLILANGQRRLWRHPPRKSVALAGTLHQPMLLSARPPSALAACPHDSAQADYR